MWLCMLLGLITRIISGDIKVLSGEEEQKQQIYNNKFNIKNMQHTELWIVTIYHQDNINRNINLLQSTPYYYLFNLLSMLQTRIMNFKIWLWIHNAMYEKSYMAKFIYYVNKDEWMNKGSLEKNDDDKTHTFLLINHWPSIEGT